MKASRQTTLRKSVTLKGAGVHSGQPAKLVLHPADANHGLVFLRTGLPNGHERLIPANHVHVTTTELCTVLGDTDTGSVSTIEHLMAALSGLGIDNVLAEVDGPEMPILDGSSAPFVFLLQSVGIEEQKVAKKFLRVKKTVEYIEGDKWVKLEPYDGFRLSFSIVFNHPAIDNTSTQVTIDFAEQSYVRDVARARTFGFMQDVEFVQANGLALGGSLENAIVMDEYRVLNAEGLRYADESGKHKVLDAIGDLYLCGHPLLAAYSAHKAGHGLNNQILRVLLEDKEAWEIVTFDQDASTPAAVSPPFAPLTPAFA